MQWTWAEEANVNDLMEKLMIFAGHRGYKAQKVGHSSVLEISKTSTVRQLSGLSSGLRLVITVKEGKTMVDVSGHGTEFATKGAIGAFAVLTGGLLAPLAATSAYGAYAQKKLADDLRKEINDYFDSLFDAE
ncbi:MAG: hypothetical protein U1E38_01430 [Rhodospirillales bacterium]